MDRTYGEGMTNTENAQAPIRPLAGGINGCFSVYIEPTDQILTAWPAFGIHPAKVTLGPNGGQGAEVTLPNGWEFPSDMDALLALAQDI